MKSLLKQIRNRIKDAENNVFCKCLRPHLLSFPDTEDNFEIVEIRLLEKVSGEIQFTKTEVTTRCSVCNTLWKVEITNTPDRRTRIWKKQTVK